MKQRFKQRILDSLSWTDDDLERLIHATPQTALHDPYLYTNMDELVDSLYRFKQEQDKDPKKLLVVDTDYDTDGEMSACVLTVALSLFNINHRVYIPLMSDGYGLSKKAVKDMEKTYPNVSAILTADNGTNAYEGVDYANSKGITVLVTDHHLGSTETANASVVVNPNVPTDRYPFKGNAGAAVAWKAMMAYAQRYAPDTLPFVYKLIVFAGIANVADVMPITDENHFMVREAVSMINDLKSAFHIPEPTPHYKTVMSGLAELVQNMQVLRDEERKKQNKKPSKLPEDEQFISWYLSPLLNAPRRVVGSPESAFKALMHHDKEVRQKNIEILYEQNKEKTRLKDDAIKQVKPEMLSEASNVIAVKTTHGISGLVAAHFANVTNQPTIVFAVRENMTDDTIISGSARSFEHAPLPLIIDAVEQMRPGTVVSGGGHAQAAGYAILKKDLSVFRELFDRASKMVQLEIAERLTDVEPVDLIQNVIKFAFYDGEDTNEFVHINITKEKDLAKNVLDVLDLYEQLKPFGKGFEAEPVIVFDIDPYQLKNHQFDPNFWKTFKANIGGVEVLTFNEDLADQVKRQIASENWSVITCRVTLKKNVFRGKTTPQFILDTL